VGLVANRIYQGDCIKRLSQVEAASIDLVFADPPFNIGYEYDVYDDRQSSQDYLHWSRGWIEGVAAALKPNGTFWLAIGDEYAAELKIISQEVGFTCRSWVIWYYTFGVNCKRGFSRSHTHLFHFVKDPRDFIFNESNPAVRVPSARQLVYADARANPKGRLPDNTWIFRPQDLPNGIPASHDTWYFSRVAGTFKEREGFHGCQMPEQLLGRIIRLCSDPHDIVLDPFAGSGTTLAVAKKLNRQWIGFELSRDYVKRVRERLQGTRVGVPLDGPEDPSRSAPKTTQGKSKALLRGAHRVRGARSAKAEKQREELAKAVIQAYKAVHEGYSTDYLLTDPELNKRFVEECSRLGAPGDAVICNQTLLRVRKQGKLPRGAQRRRRISPHEMDAYSHASEVALHQVSVEANVTLDGILCDPDLAGHFDALAARFAPGRYTSFEYRWAALSLRKRAKSAKRLARKYEQWLDQPLPKPHALAKLPTTDDWKSGVYVLLGRSGVVVYVGETGELSQRLAQVVANEAWQELDLKAVHVFPAEEQGRLGLKAILIQRLGPALNSTLLFPSLQPEPV
jgi:site-specific DNA-methyltransferase (adenine-specific)